MMKQEAGLGNNHVMDNSGETIDKLRRVGLDAESRVVTVCRDNNFNTIVS